MALPKRHHCWKCNTTIRSRKPSRITKHELSCQRKTRRVLKPRDAEDEARKRRSNPAERSASVDSYTDQTRQTPSLYHWLSNECPVNDCKAHVRNRNLREQHIKGHARRSNLKRTPAEFLFECMESSAGPSDTNSTLPTERSSLIGSSSSTAVPPPISEEPTATAFYELTRPISRVENVALKSLEERLSFKLSERGLSLARDGHLLSLIDTIIRDVIDKHLGNEHARLRIVFDSDSLDYAFSGTFQRADEFDVFSFLEQLERILNSKQTVKFDDTIQLYVQSVADPMSGAGRSTLRRKDYANTRDFFRQRCSVFFIDNDDHSCFFLAIAAGLRFMKLAGPKSRNGSMKNMAWFRSPHKNKQLKIEGVALRNAVHHSEDQPVNPNVFPTMQDYLNQQYHVQLIVFNCEDADRVYYSGEPARPPSKRLYLTFGDHHYCYVKNQIPYLQKHNLCNLCYKSYWKIHKCQLKCDRCATRQCFDHRKSSNKLGCLKATTKCKGCGLLFYSSNCLDQHRLKRVCKKYIQCSKCERIHRKDQSHDCENMKCSNCKRWVTIPHLCTTQPPNLINKNKFVYIIFDIETFVDGQGVHKPYLVCCDRLCENCCDTVEDDEGECAKCGPRTKVFWGTDCISEFCKFIIHPNNEDNHRSGFDNYFIVDQVIGDNGQLDVMTRGHRFLSVKLGRNIKMLDTYLFFFCKLSALTSIFEIPETKGFFPFKMASPETLNYVSAKHPDRECYGFSQMSAAERLRFLEWYNQVSDTTFDFKKEAIVYCRMDVSLLRIAAMLFRRFLVDTYGVDPWQHAVSLSHLASLIYRKCYLPNGDLLAIVPTTGYTDLYRKQTSLLCVKYLEWIMKETATTIIHGGTQLEPRFLGRFPCDGVELKNPDGQMVLQNVNRIWDIRGCFYHVHRDGCTINRRIPDTQMAYTPANISKLHSLNKSITFRDIMDADNMRVQWFESRGINVSIVYECEIYQLKREHAQFAEFFNDKRKWNQYVMPIGPRDSLFGGRVTLGRMLIELTDEQISQGYQILYDDFISLYPSVMRYQSFPVGHPEIIKHPNLPESITRKNIEEYFGLIKARVLPAQNLLYGVLPHKVNGKLLFPLCLQCADEYSSRVLNDIDFDDIGNVECCHDVNQRSFWGVFCSVELELALEMGYIVLEVSEIWCYEAGDLFSNYVNGMISMKVENSGYPDNCITDDDKQDYVRAMAADNIIIDPDKIRRCSGKRAIGKLFANSLWGKICQGIERTETKFVREPKELSMLLRDPSIEISDVMFLNRGKCLCVSYKHNNDVRRNMSLYSPTVGSFVTSYGRIRLYKLMVAAGKNFIYGDTDSVIYLTGPNMFKSKHGTKVGEVASEIGWPDDFITNFVSTGPKTYGYKTHRGLSMIKAKGLSLKCKLGETVNFDHLKMIVLGQRDEIIKNFYDRLDEPIRSRLKTQHQVKIGTQTDEHKTFILIPQSRIKKDKRSLTLENDDMIKILQTSGGDKRRLLRHHSLRTVEFGYKTQTNFF